MATVLICDRYDRVICTAGVDWFQNRAKMSNLGERVNVYAPSAGIITASIQGSRQNEATSEKDGTGNAAAYTSAIMSLFVGVENLKQPEHVAVAHLRLMDNAERDFCTKKGWWIMTPSYQYVTVSCYALNSGLYNPLRDPLAPYLGGPITGWAVEPLKRTQPEWWGLYSQDKSD